MQDINQQSIDQTFEERVIAIDRIARVVKGGRRFRFRALVVVGNRQGQVGMGVSKGSDVTAAVSKATDQAKKHLIRVPLYQGRTLPHEINIKRGAAKILLKPASPGTGLIAGGAIRVILEVAGIHDVLSKSFGTSNKINASYATIAALEQLQDLENLPRVKKKVTAAKPAQAAKEG